MKYGEQEGEEGREGGVSAGFGLSFYDMIGYVRKR